MSMAFRHVKMSIQKMSNYKSTIKLSVSAASGKPSKYGGEAAAATMPLFMKIILIHLLILLQCLLCATTTATTAATQSLNHTLDKDNLQPELAVAAKTTGLSSTTPITPTTIIKALAVANDSSNDNNNNNNDDTSNVNTAMQSGNAVTAAGDNDGNAHNDIAAAAAADNDLSPINQLFTHLTNATLLHDASAHEYDASTVRLLGNVTHSCLQTCIEEETRFVNEFGVKCSMGDNRTECYRQRCFKGCELWWNALKEFEPCQEACSSTQFYPFDLPCISACEQSQRHYWHLQRLRSQPVVTSVRPQLLHDTDVLNTLTLKWPISAELLPVQYFASRPFNIQYQYVLEPPPNWAPSSAEPSTAFVNDTTGINGHGQDDYSQQDVEIAKQWWNLADYNCNENFECDIMDGLVPYMTYRFRFEIPFGQNLDDVLYTPASEVFTTPPMGAPISAPVIKQAIALSKSHLAIFWTQGKHTNGPLKNYKLEVAGGSDDEENGISDEMLLPPNATYIILSNSEHEDYTIRLAMINEEGEGPYAETQLKKPIASHASSTKFNLNTLLVSSEHGIVLKSLDPLIETKTLFKTSEAIADFDVNHHTRQLFVLDSRGQLFSFYIENPLNYSEIIFKPKNVNFVARKISVDWLNLRLYMAGEISPSHWQLIVTDLQGSIIEILAENIATPIKSIQVDPLNGWIFATTTEDQLLRINLSNGLLTPLPSHLRITAFTNDYEHFMLKTFDDEERSVYELSYDGLYSKKLSDRIPYKFEGSILGFYYLDDICLMAANGTHFLMQDNESKKLDLLALDELAEKVVPLFAGREAKLLQPVPRPLKSPGNLQAVLSDTKAKISWSPPQKLEEFQTPASWHSWEYELEIMDVSSNSAFNIRGIKSRYFEVERLQANNLYKIKVRAMFVALSGRLSSDSSEWSEELMTRTWPMANHRLLWASQRGLFESNELAEAVELRRGVTQAEGIQSFVQVNSSLYYVTISDGRRELKCLNLMNPEVMCGFRAENVFSMDYDWRGGRLYWSDVKRNCILRSDLKGKNMELLPIFEARQIKVDSLRGYLYYSSDSRLVRRYLNGALPAEELEYYQINGNGEVIKGFTLDSMANQLYWLVQHQEEPLRLFRSDVDLPKTEEYLELPADVGAVEESLQYVREIEGFLLLRSDRNTAVMLRKEFPGHVAEIQTPFQGERLNFVNLRKDFMGFMDYRIVPDAVDREAIRITEGFWDDFNIKWPAPGNSEHLSLIYRVLVASVGDNSTARDVLSFEVAQPLVRITELKISSHMINVSITPESWWSKGPTSWSLLRTPSADPKQPKNLRVFVEQLQEPLQDEANITALLRWEAADNLSNEKEAFYKVFCWHKDELFSVKDIEDMGRDTHEMRFYNLHQDATYMFQVQAFSLSRSKGGEKSALLTYHINPEFQARPKLMFSTPEYIGELDMDLGSSKVWLYTSSEVEHMAVMPGEQRLIWVNDNVELMTYQPGSSALKLARMRAEVLSLAVDWIQRQVYWAELSGDIERPVDVYVLDLTQYEGKVMLGQRLFSLSNGRLLRDLQVLPYSQLMLWLEYDLETKEGSLQARSLKNLGEVKLKNLPLAPLQSLFEGSWSADMETVNLVDVKGKLYSYEIERQILVTTKIPIMSGDSGTDFERDAGYIYCLSNHTLRAYNRRKHNLEYSMNFEDIKVIKAFNYQRYPPRECLLPAESHKEGEKEEERGEAEREEELLKTRLVKAVGQRYVLLQPPQHNFLGQCELPIPGLKYHLHLEQEGNLRQHFELSGNFSQLNVTDLRPYTNYTLTLEAYSYYQQKLGLNGTTYPPFTVLTLPGTPSQPRNFSLEVISPTEVLATWQEPEELNAPQVRYALSFMEDGAARGYRVDLEELEYTLRNLKPLSKYFIWISVYAGDEMNSTEKVAVNTYAEPQDLLLVEAQPFNLTLFWNSSIDYSSVILECLPHSQDPEVTAFSVDISQLDGNITITNLEPKTKYEFYFKLVYPRSSHPYIWPVEQAGHFLYETLGTAPGRPGRPMLELISGEIFKINWEPARPHGAQGLHYSLEGLQARNSKRSRREAIAAASYDSSNLNHTSSISVISQLPWAEELQPIEDKWIVVCNTTELSCIIRELHTLRLLMFRVRAHSKEYGWGPYSEDSERVLEPYVSPQKRNSLVLAIMAPVVIVATCVIILFVIRKVHKRRLKAKQLLAKSRPSIWSNVSSMQQQFDRNRAFSMTSNATMYTGGPLSDADIALLPHVNWSQISLLNFLGSGAFGEVYEGLLKHEDNETPEKVAIKTLRKGASEFAELLQEAQLMSNFKHENIVRLIGVCCDTESISIIMEHMEGGDLLSYLRESRPNSTKPVASLQLLDLMSMCIDVATGMAYLEDMHFVHRDLACRNCLVSSRIPSRRVVKIGDFGLARDIYKSDYYRKEGEALVPVRWMAPESLVDGVFTTQSDVWAFGVLCWEILTLGQQPYAVRNNFEVLTFVKEGGRLEQPDNCPDKLFTLMSECWLSDPEERPSFRKIFNTLLSVKTDVRRVSLGYNIDDSDYAMYANQHGIVFSSFLGTPLNKVNEERREEEEESSESTYECKQNLKNEEETKLNANGRCGEPMEKIDMKVHFESGSHMVKTSDCDSLNDEAHLIDAKLYRMQENPDYYINEGVSRL
ncbi:protein sevenless [Musca domestica]|uniref:Tyrosine-protein kinase receptor n=1 Tax=Musca domestica TaxID=7370 RepID=A0ABM3UY31_MUSDO|nr:protein sevenless [Musca domestica]